MLRENFFAVIWLRFFFQWTRESLKLNTVSIWLHIIFIIINNRFMIYRHLWEVILKLFLGSNVNWCFLIVKRKEIWVFHLQTFFVCLNYGTSNYHRSYCWITVIYFCVRLIYLRWTRTFIMFFVLNFNRFDRINYCLHRLFVMDYCLVWWLFHHLRQIIFGSNWLSIDILNTHTNAAIILE